MTQKTTPRFWCAWRHQNGPNAATAGRKRENPQPPHIRAPGRVRPRALTPPVVCGAASAMRQAHGSQLCPGLGPAAIIMGACQWVWHAPYGNAVPTRGHPAGWAHPRGPLRLPPAAGRSMGRVCGGVCDDYATQAASSLTVFHFFFSFLTICLTVVFVPEQTKLFRN